MQLFFNAPSLAARRGCCQPLPAPPHKAQSPHPCRGAAASRGPRDGAAGEIQPGKGARGRTFGYAERARSIPTAPHLQPNFLQRGRPQATSSRAVAPSPAATPFPPSLQPRPGAPSLLPEGAAAVPARRWGGGSGGARGALPARGERPGWLQPEHRGSLGGSGAAPHPADSTPCTCR